MIKVGDEVFVIIDNEIKSGLVYDIKDNECRVADGELKPGKFSYSAWIDIGNVVPKYLYDIKRRKISNI